MKTFSRRCEKNEEIWKIFLPASEKRGIERGEVDPCLPYITMAVMKDFHLLLSIFFSCARQQQSRQKPFRESQYAWVKDSQRRHLTHIKHNTVFIAIVTHLARKSEARKLQEKVQNFRDNTRVSKAGRRLGHKSCCSWQTPYCSPTTATLSSQSLCSECRFSRF